MAEQSEDQAEEALEPAPRRRRLGWRLGVVAAILLAAILGYAWVSRKELAQDLITRELDKMGLNARYRIEEIGPRRQVISHIVIGDPAHPDLTIERVEMQLVVRFPFPGIGQLTVVKPRLYGSYHQGKLSFGSLDKMLFGQPSTQPFRMPDMVLSLQDGRALMETDYGPVGIKAQGYGHLRDGFDGILAATAPVLAAQGCRADKATLYGSLHVRAERPGFTGPLRLASLACPDSGLALRDVGLQLDGEAERTLDGVEGDVGFKTGPATLATNRLASLSGTSRIDWRKGAFTAKYGVTGKGLETPQLAMASLGLEGAVRSRENFARMEVEADVKGQKIRPGPALDRALRSAAQSASGTLAGPMLEQIRSALLREGQGSSLTASATLRKTGAAYSLVVPQARLNGTSGQALLALSRFQVALNEGSPRFTGNFATGGPGLPQISGRMEQDGANEIQLRLRMADYRVKGGSLAVPDLMVAQGRNGAIGFAGRAIASGPIPGGSARNLTLPILGNWSPDRGLSVWRQCTAIAFDSLRIANLALDKRRLQLCPPPGGAIVRSTAKGTSFAAGTPSLDLSGRLGETRVVLRSGAVGLAWPGNLKARNIDVSLGPPESETRFRLANLDARIRSDVSGRFAGAEARLFAVPLDILQAEGNWRFAGGKLELSGGAFRLEDREQVDRFQPLIARDATLTLADNRIAAHAVLREPKSDRVVTAADIVHDLSDGSGQADLDVAGLQFDDKLQPDTLSALALGVIANAKGVVTGKGRIEWDAEHVSSSGQFSTANLDFAAAFGPVQGVSGTVTFTDLLGLVTAPNQKLRIKSFNPGIQVDEGDLSFELHPGYELAIQGGSWPFIGGKLILEPTTTRLTVAEPRHYTLRLEGVDAAQFVERMDLANIAATGTFDGTVPLVFDQNGGRIEQGRLKSRPPGGNLSYVGELTYKDLSTMANFAFDALKSLDYREMEILLDGSLTGEIVTKVRFDGIRQGASAKQNFATRQLAKLPIRFNVNIHAPFYQLITAVHGLYDPAYVRDPRDLGLIDANGKPVQSPTLNHTPAIKPPATKPEDLPGDEATIQP